MARSIRSASLTVILHADVADSTDLVQRDEFLAHDEIQAAFQRFANIIKKYHGRVRELRGDALIAEFHRASDAVSAALAFQQKNGAAPDADGNNLKPLVRIGIAMGEVVIADNTVTGAGVVLAQRVEQQAEPGQVCITSAIHEALPKRMPFDLQNLGDQTLKGFDDPVRMFRVCLHPGENIPDPQAEPGAQAFRIPPPTLIVATSILLAFAVVAVFVLKTNAPQQVTIAREKPVVAVLPLTNASEDTEDYFVDGVTEDIITDLSQLNGLAVIARNSSFKFRDSSETVQEICTKLSANYLVQGSVRRDGKQIRISAQLVDGKTGHELWADRYDRELTDTFELQDEITREVVSALSIEISGDEKRQIDYKSASNFDAYELLLKAQIAGVTFSREGIAEAQNLYRRAIELDPDYARAYGGLAVQLTREVTLGYSDNPAENRARALEMALKGVEINPELPQVQLALGYVYMYQGDFDNAIEALDRAISLSPSYADGYAMLALIRNNLGQAEDAIRLIKKGMELNPYYSWDYLFLLGRAHYALGDYQQAAELLEQALQRNASARAVHLFLAAAYVRLGRQDDAEWEIMQLQISNPETTLSQIHYVLVIKNEELLNRLIDDLRSAGMEE